MANYAILLQDLEDILFNKKLKADFLDSGKKLKIEQNVLLHPKLFLLTPYFPKNEGLW